VCRGFAHTVCGASRSENLGVSRDELRSAVAKAGPMVKTRGDHLQHCS
jgi:hypothetical protein